MNLLENREARIAIALGIGLLIGTERERRREETGAGIAGVRTFALSSLLGGVLAYLGHPALVVAGAAVVGAFAVVGYVVNRTVADRGITTEVALVVAYALGALSLDAPALAPAVAVVMTWVLALRGEIHRLVLRTITARELRDLLLFLLIALVVLPVAPDRAIGPYGAVNPQALTRLLVVLLGITGAGYVVARVLSPRLGMAVTGFVSGFVSSSATIAAMGLRARERPEEWRSAAAGGLASSVATVVQYVVVVAAIDGTLAVALLPSFGLAGVAAVAGSAIFGWLSSLEQGPPEPPGRAFRLSAALGFAAVFVVVAILSAALGERIGDRSIVVVSAVAALVDAHSTAGSVASLHHGGGLSTDTAELALLTALSTNSITKLVLAWSGRHVRYALSVSVGVVAIAVSAWVGAGLS